MAGSTITRQRNLSLECCKLIAACFVVFIHIPFPWPVGEFVLCLARFAVPMFFAISGWYSYQARPGKLAKRMGHVLLLELVGIGIMLLWGIIAALYVGRDMKEMLLEALPGAEQLKLWLLFNEDPYGGQLWYLSASALCYAVLWLYTRLGGTRWGYRPMYVLGGCLLGAHFAMGELSKFTGLTVYFKIYRSGIFFGLPMFLMGLFLRENRDRLLSKLKTPQLLLLMLGGTLISIGEWKYFDVYDLYMGLLLSVPALLLLTARYPGVPRWMEGIAGACGTVSMVVYLVHLAVNDIYLGFVQWRLAQYVGSWEPWLQPWGVLAMSLAAGVLWWLVLQLWGKLRKAK